MSGALLAGGFGVEDRARGWFVGNILHGEGGSLQVLPQNLILFRRQLLLVEGLAHVHQPMVARCRVDGKANVPHPKPGVAALIAVVGGSAPVLLQERAQPPFGRVQRTGGVHGAQDVVVRNPFVEGRHETGEEIPTTEYLVGGLLGLLAHTVIVSDTYAAEASRFADSARSTMCRAMGGKTKAWNGATDHQ